MSEVRVRNLLSPDGGFPDNIKNVVADIYGVVNADATLGFNEGISSVIDNGAGDYTVNFSTARVTSDFVTLLTIGSDGLGSDRLYARNVSSISYRTADGTGTLADRAVNLAIIGGQ